MVMIMDRFTAHCRSLVGIRGNYLFGMIRRFVEEDLRDEEESMEDEDSLRRRINRLFMPDDRVFREDN